MLDAATAAKEFWKGGVNPFSEHAEIPAAQREIWQQIASGLEMISSALRKL